MTANQINYQNYLESVRTHKANEEIAARQAAASETSALASYRSSEASLMQASSSQRSAEASVLNAQASQTNAAANWANAQTNLVSANENIRHNKQVEAENVRHNKAVEQNEITKAYINADTQLAINDAQVAVSRENVLTQTSTSEKNTQVSAGSNVLNGLMGLGTRLFMGG